MNLAQLTQDKYKYLNIHVWPAMLLRSPLSAGFLQFDENWDLCPISLFPYKIYWPCGNYVSELIYRKDIPELVHVSANVWEIDTYLAHYLLKNHQ